MLKYFMRTRDGIQLSFIVEGDTMKKKCIVAATGLVITTSLLASPIAATASPVAHSASPVAHSALFEAHSTSGEWTKLDWSQIANDAERAGDVRGAADALEIRDAAAASSPSRNLWTSLAKKAVLEILKHATSKLPAKIRPYAHKIIGVIEEIDSFQQTAVVAALTRAGIPYDVSVATAQWIVFFLGL